VLLQQHRRRAETPALHLQAHRTEFLLTMNKRILALAIALSLAFAVPAYAQTAVSSKAYEIHNSAIVIDTQNSAIAEQVANALRYFDEKRYRLFAWCVMPNHVHVVARFFPAQTLATVVHSWKSFSAKQANQILGRHGVFWQREYYDHLIRSEEEFERAIRYVTENPAKAQLKDWKWVGERDARPTAAGDGGATLL
jgi:REP element-mobilizing transposase RayT